MDTHFESLYPDAVRFKEIEQILAFIKGGNSCQILGIPGVGRSNLFGALAYNRNVRLKHLGENQKWFHFVMINFSEIRKRPLLDATKFIFLNLVDSLRERKLDEEYHAANDILKESLSFNDELILFQGLKRVVDLLALEKELTIVFLFDRFELYIPMLTPEFFNNLRTLRNRAKYRFSVVFSLERPLEDVLENTIFADFYEFVAGHLVFLDLSDKEGIDFRISYLEKVTGKKLDKKIINHVLELTSGHPKLTKVSIESILALSPKEKQLNAIRSTLNANKTVQGVLWEFWNFLTPEEQNVLRSHLEGVSQYLEKVGLVKNNKPRIPLFEEFIKTVISPTIQQLSNLTIVYDENTNDIIKGQQTISDKLTSLEFKLLKFFILNKERIIDREEVIQTVWANAKSTAGVTDQALDQLIFRLRKKIEDDPNNPKNLQTIKGRGFRFAP